MSTRIQNVQPKEYNGKTYRSTLEAKTAKVLDSLGIPYEYESMKIQLLEGFRCPYQTHKVIGVTYTPDFIVGPAIIECKGFETPEWKLKKKYVFKYLMQKEPSKTFYQISDCNKSLLEVLDNYWRYFGYAVQVTQKPKKLKKKKIPEETKPRIFDSIKEATEALGLTGRPIGRILRSLTGDTTYIYNYKWELIKLNL